MRVLLVIYLSTRPVSTRVFWKLIAVFLGSLQTWKNTSAFLQAQLVMLLKKSLESSLLSAGRAASNGVNSFV